jgi:hypothetical protein
VVSGSKPTGAVMAQPHEKMYDEGASKVVFSSADEKNYGYMENSFIC